MRKKGKLTTWNEDKAFGFISPSLKGKDIFIHKSAFSNRSRTPKIDDIITYTESKDKKGRICAIDATFTGEKPIVRKAKEVNKFSIYFAVLFLLLALVASLLSYFPIKLFTAYLMLSGITYFAYALDKHKAKRGLWRTSEGTLHLFSMLGGWPGAAIAQQLLRHKSQKRDFRNVFWMTVFINLGGLVWLFSENGQSTLELIKHL